VDKPHNALLARVGTALYQQVDLQQADLDAVYDEIEALVADVERLRGERDAYHEAWARAQARLDCGADATEAVREERAAVVAWLHAWGGNLAVAADAIERGEHRSEEEK
jgi:hypothetical protein